MNKNIEVLSEPRITPEYKAMADSKASHTRQEISISRGLQRRHRVSDGVMKPLLLIIVIAIVLTATMVFAENTRPMENTDETIAYLLAFVAKSDCTFIRNGQPYTDKQASRHMQDKRRYFKDQIVTPEDFIRLAATKSLQTGQPYMIRTKEGKELRCDEWLKEVLKEYRKTKKG